MALPLSRVACCWPRRWGCEMLTCACCGYVFDRDEVEIALDWQGDECFMCHRCYREDCDCNEPMYVLEPDLHEEDDSPEAWEGVRDV